MKVKDEFMAKELQEAYMQMCKNEHVKQLRTTESEFDHKYGKAILAMPLEDNSISIFYANGHLLNYKNNEDGSMDILWLNELPYRIDNIRKIVNDTLNVSLNNENIGLIEDPNQIRILASLKNDIVKLANEAVNLNNIFPKTYITNINGKYYCSVVNFNRTVSIYKINID